MQPLENSALVSKPKGDLCNKWDIIKMVLKIKGCDYADIIQVAHVKMVRKLWDPLKAGHSMTSSWTTLNSIK